MRALSLCFVAGVCWLQQLAHLPDLRWIWGLPLLASAILFLPRHQVIWRRLLLWLTVLLCGLLFADWRADIAFADRLPYAWQNVDIRLDGVVTGIPQSGLRGERLDLQVRQVCTPAARVPSRIRVYVAGHDRQFAPGQEWQLTVRLQRPHASQNPHVTDLEAIWFSEGIAALGMVDNRQPMQLMSTRAASVWQRIDRLRQRIDERIDAQLPGSPSAGILRALVVGDQSAITDAQWQLFQQTGIVHLVSVSGSHVTLLAGMLFALVYWVWRRHDWLAGRVPARRAAALASALLATFYVMLAGSGIPAQRTLLMLWVVALAQWRGRPLPSSVVLAMALLVVVLVDPWSVLAPGFWLSFGAVALLLMLSATRFARQGQLLAWWRAQWVVTLGLMPVMLMLFGQFSVSAPLANAVAIPVIEMLVTPLALAGAIPHLGFLLLPADWLLRALLWYLARLDWLPLWQQAPPTLLAGGLALTGALWLLLPRGFPSRYLGLLLLLPALAGPAGQPLQSGDLEADVLDVGQGLSVVLRTAHHVWLYDTGPRHGVNGDSGAHIVLPWLAGEGVRRLDGLILSHDDIDHTGGAQAILAREPVGWVLTSLPRSHALFRAGIGRLWHRCQTGEHWQADGVTFQVLYPQADGYQLAHVRDNHRSCVVKVTAAAGSLLLTGDIEASDEQSLLAQCRNCLAAQVLLAPHHGSRTSSTPEFIAAVAPVWVIFSVGAHNPFGHPAPEVVARYRAAGIAGLRSDRDGMIRLRWIGGRFIGPLPWRQVGAHYWWDNVDDHG